MKKALQSENKSSTKWEKSSTKWIKALQSENKSENRQVLSYLIANFSAPLFAKVGHLVPHWSTIFESVKSAPLFGALVLICFILSYLIISLLLVPHFFAKVGHLVTHWGTIFESVKSDPLNGSLIFVCLCIYMFTCLYLYMFVCL